MSLASFGSHRLSGTEFGLFAIVICYCSTSSASAAPNFEVFLFSLFRAITGSLGCRYTLLCLTNGLRKVLFVWLKVIARNIRLYAEWWLQIKVANQLASVIIQDIRWHDVPKLWVIYPGRLACVYGSRFVSSLMPCGSDALALWWRPTAWFVTAYPLFRTIV